MADVPGSSGPDTLYGTPDADTIHGEGGHDILTGFLGADRLDGGAGIDTAHYFDSVTAVTVNLSDGRGLGGSAQGDVLVSIENLWGSNYNDTLIGNGWTNELTGFIGADILKGGGGADGLDGGDGDDTLKGGGGADHMIGGSGNDTADYSEQNRGVYVDLEQGEGFTYDEGEDEDTLVGIENVAGGSSNDVIFGDDGANVLRGLGGNDRLVGRGGADRLEGGDGNDRLLGNEDSDSGPDSGDLMIGGKGNDLYTVTDAGDTILEYAGEGRDEIHVSISSYTMPDNTEVLFMTSPATGGTARGNALDNVIYATAGDDTINGRAGADIMVGGGGRDLLFVDNAGDRIEEFVVSSPANFDRVLASVSYTLNARGGADLITTTDSSLTTAINLTGNEFGQRIIGNSGDNGLTGRGGLDTLEGGLGNDTYVLEAENDVVIDSGGYDTISTTASRSLAGYAAIERLVLAGAADIDGTGNGLANALLGNAGANRLEGGDGADTLTGKLGRDILRGGAGRDIFDFNAVNETGTTASTRDAITDFEQRLDKIDLATIDANGGLSGNAFSFIGTLAFGGVGQLRYFKIDNVDNALDQTIIEGNVTGDAAPDFQIRLTGLFDLAESDFTL